MTCLTGVSKLNGDCRDILPTLPERSIHCCVTSPPYFGLRDYGVDGQIGLEEKPDCLGWATGESCGECYVCHLVAVFRKVWRVLRDDGTVWLNLGDSYPNGGRGSRGSDPKHVGRVDMQTRPRDGFKSKDLIGIPWRVVFALQVDGWYLRSDIIWSKSNSIPESVTDRPTRSHEYLFLLTKSKRYYYNHEAIKEPAKYESEQRYKRGRSDSHKYADGGPGSQTIAKGFDHIKKKSACSFARKTATKGKPGAPDQHRADRDDIQYCGSRNKRSVWTISTSSYNGAHFAVFPPKLVEPCIKAGCPEGCVVLDPFTGSGTTGMVAVRNRRNAVLVELNPDYLSLQEERVSNVQLKAF